MTDPAGTQSDAPRLLLADDDAVFCEVLGRVLGGRGFAVTIAHDVAEALAVARREPPEYAIVDLRMPGPSGLVLVSELVALEPHIRIVVLTGYASIATAVEAIKLGAVQYLTKPAEVDDIIAALDAPPNPRMPVDERRLSPERVEWEYLQRMLMEHGGNISVTARVLGMHRRTLQRKLQKRPARK